MQELTPDKKCGRCFHWHEQARNAMALGEHRGECKQGPPSLVAVTQGGTNVQVIAMYPQVGPAFPACQQFITKRHALGMAKHSIEAISEEAMLRGRDDGEPAPAAAAVGG